MQTDKDVKISAEQTWLYRRKDSNHFFFNVDGEREREREQERKRERKGRRTEGGKKKSGKGAILYKLSFFIKRKCNNGPSLRR